ILSCDPDFAGVIAFDEFKQTIVTTRAPKWYTDDAPEIVEPGEWSDADTIRTQAWLARRYELTLGREAVADAVRVVAEQQRAHAVREYLLGLPAHDGEKRLDSW